MTGGTSSRYTSISLIKENLKQLLFFVFHEIFMFIVLSLCVVYEGGCEILNPSGVLNNAYSFIFHDFHFSLLIILNVQCASY